MNKSILALLSVMSLGCATSTSANDQARPDFPQARGDGPFQFALIGDTPYNVAVGSAYAPFDDMVAEINADARLRFVLHAGDIKSGSEPCSDALFADRLGRFQQFKAPFIITPGDNEWTDCHRANNGGFAPLERLAALRQLLYPVPGQTLGQRPAQLETQAALGYPENVRWTHHGVVFAALHVVGSSNGLAPFATRTAADDAEVAARSAATLHWMHAAFDLAESTDAPGLLLLMQANPGLEFVVNPADRFGFETLLEQLEARVVAYGKPVVLAHGDSHYYRVDKPRLDKRAFLPDFTRVETFGAANVHWIRVSVDPRSDDVFFFDAEVVAPR